MLSFLKASIVLLHNVRCILIITNKSETLRAQEKIIKIDYSPHKICGW